MKRHRGHGKSKACNAAGNIKRLDCVPYRPNWRERWAVEILGHQRAPQ